MDEQRVREAIELLEICVAGYTDVIRRNPDDEELLLKAIEKKNQLETAIEALEKQLSKKVDAKEEYRDFHGRLLYYKGFCPNCGFIVQSNKNKCCSCCTQMLDWSE